MGFYTGLAFIVSGVGMLKPNISTMVGGLYKKNDIRRDKGFTIFYIGINIGAFLSSIIVGGVGEVYGWHYGFGMAGIFMLIGLIQFIYGQKYLVGVGDLIQKSKTTTETTENESLSKVEKNRISVLFLSFLMIIVFFAAFEQAGGLMNLYTREKTTRVLLGMEIPATWFQALNAFLLLL